MSRAGVVNTIGVVLVALALAVCGQDATWQRAIGRWGANLTLSRVPSRAESWYAYQIQIDADGTGVLWSEHFDQPVKFTWSKSRVDDTTYKFDLTRADGEKESYLLQPVSVDSLHMLTADKQERYVLVPLREDQFAPTELMALERKAQAEYDEYHEVNVGSNERDGKAADVELRMRNISAGVKMSILRKPAIPALEDAIDYLDRDNRKQITENPNDPWGTPYRLNEIGSLAWEIRSAGPDKKMDTADDLVLKQRNTD